MPRDRTDSTAASSKEGVTASEFKVPAAYLAMLARDGHHNVPGFLHANAEMLRGLDLAGKRVLEIGSGRGLIAILIGLQGAARVVSMEPELVGATSGVIADQRARIAQLALTNVEVVAADFNTWDSAGETFDIIVSRASINHLYASEHHALRHRDTYDNYLRVARHIHGLLAPGGVFIATDACRYGFFSLARRFGIRRPWKWSKSGVDWRHHQNPGTWRRIFLGAGFSRVGIRYPVPYPLRHLSSLVDSMIANFFLKGTFVLRAYR